MNKLKTLSALLIIMASFMASNSCKNEDSKELSIPTVTMVVKFDLEMANKLSQLAFHCIDTEYPNKLGQVLGSDQDLKSPKELRPAFYGCFDWHSAVHGHWTLVKLLKQFPDLHNRDSIIAKIDKNLTPLNIATEMEFWRGPHNKSFERTYGWAWLLKLQEELLSWNDSMGRKWSSALNPLVGLLRNKYKEFLPKLNYPIRVGEHSNTAFGLKFALDYALSAEETEFVNIIKSRSIDYYKNDINCPMDWEPSGFDFLSPCLEEAHLMSKVLEKEAFKKWWEEFMAKNSIYTLAPATSLDLTDGKLVHLVGLNFSRAWCLYEIAAILEDKQLKNIADNHVATSIEDVINGDYAGEHWLASFAVMALQK